MAVFSAFERTVAMRYLRSRRAEGFISVIAGFSLAGIALGVATLIIVMSVMNGFRAQLQALILGFNGHLTVTSVQGPMTDFDSVTYRLLDIPQITGITPMIEGQVMINAAGRASGAIVRGMRREDVLAHRILADHIVAGSLDQFEGTDVIMIGARMAENFGVRVGGEMTLIAPQGTVTMVGTVPRIKTFTVVAIFDVGMSEYDSNFIYMPLAAAQLFFKYPQAVSGLEIMIDDPDKAGALAYQVATKAGAEYRVTTWQQRNSSFFTAIRVERNVMFLILTLIILVAALNIVSGQIMLVKDKGRDIAILRTMGATRGMIMRIFLLSGASIGIVGTLAGLVIGVAFADNIESIRQWLQGLTGTNLFSPEIYFLSQLPAIIDPWDVVSVVVMSLSLSFLATLYPSWRAARLDPVEALRYE
ncbi:MAG: lipoprotein-releasing ABC transporter permease subunit [Rhodospirillaceae bacterium]|nr:lipoprotein-releasing ABC transporter permease subunit [Rhodospirillaceae bacterium]